MEITGERRKVEDPDRKQPLFRAELRDRREVHDAWIMMNIKIVLFFVIYAALVVRGCIINNVFTKKSLYCFNLSTRNV